MPLSLKLFVLAVSWANVVVVVVAVTVVTGTVIGIGNGAGTACVILLLLLLLLPQSEFFLLLFKALMLLLVDVVELHESPLVHLSLVVEIKEGAVSGALYFKGGISGKRGDRIGRQLSMPFCDGRGGLLPLHDKGMLVCLCFALFSYPTPFSLFSQTVLVLLEL